MKKLIPFLCLAVLLASCATTKSQEPVTFDVAGNPVSTNLYSETKVQFQANGRTIIGTICMPKDAKNVPGVVMLHGTGSSRDEAGNGYAYCAPALASAGIASIRIDFPGYGESPEDYSVYNYKTATEDAIAAKAELVKSGSVNAKKVGVLGWSQGGTNALSAAAADPSFKSVALWAGALDLTTMVNQQMYDEAMKQGYSMLEMGWRTPLKIGKQWFIDAYTTDMDAVVKSIKAPILAINGSKDEDVDPKSGTHIAEIAQNKKSRQYMVEGADHTYGVFTDPSLKYLSETISETVNWFRDTL